MASHRRSIGMRSVGARAVAVAVAGAVAVLTVSLDAGQALPAGAAGAVEPGRAGAPAPRTDRASGSPALFDQPTRPRLATTLDQLLGTRSDDVSAFAVNLRTGQTVSYGQRAGMATASIAKVDILLTFLVQEQAAGTLPSASETTLATAMITRSDNAAASSLWSAVGGGGGVAEANRRFGLRATVPGPTSYWGSTTTNAEDQVRLMRLVLEPNALLDTAYRAYALRLLQSVATDQRWGVSAAADSGIVALKNGWLPRVVDADRWVVTSVGRVTAAGDPLVLAVLTRSSPTMPTGISMVEAVSVAMRDALVAGSTDASAAAG